MMACEIFQYKIISPFVIMNGTRSATILRQFANWDGPCKVTFNPNHCRKKRLLHLFRLVALVIFR